MEVSDYINNMITFYNEITKYPFVKLIHELGANSTHFSKIVFKSENKVIQYNLGFSVGKTCFVFNKLACKNLMILEELLSNEYTELLFTVELKKNKAIFKLYDIFGKCIKKSKIKFVSINMFRRY